MNSVFAEFLHKMLHENNDCEYYECFIIFYPWLNLEILIPIEFYSYAPFEKVLLYAQSNN